MSKKNVIPCLISLLNVNDDSREVLFNVIGQQKMNANKTNIQELPIKTEDILSFKYRCTNVVSGISRKQMETLKALDVKNKS